MSGRIRYEVSCVSAQTIRQSRSKVGPLRTELWLVAVAAAPVALAMCLNAANGRHMKIHISFFTHLHALNGASKLLASCLRVVRTPKQHQHPKFPDTCLIPTPSDYWCYVLVTVLPRPPLLLTHCSLQFAGDHAAPFCALI
ncbi:hypothetical protein COO60DRAFT_973756 [Scenedesmus sp. NREL 46B-D3]|nr:hypothetical protein COO60DRAFT_973756 [Scenedesmus sp. NREL 46B-D3]